MEELVESWRINARLNAYLLDNIPDDQLQTKLAKGKTVAGNFAHIHNVRLMWLKEAARDLWEEQVKIEDAAPGRELLLASLKASAEAIEVLLGRAETPGGRVKGFKPHAAAFVGYLISHEAYHRTCVELALRQAGTPLPDKISYGLWEWGVR